MENITVASFRTTYIDPVTSDCRPAQIFLVPREENQEPLLILEIWNVPPDFRYHFAVSGDKKSKVNDCFQVAFNGTKDIRKALIEQAETALGLG